MTVGKIIVGQTFVGQMTVGKMIVGQMNRTHFLEGFLSVSSASLFLFRPILVVFFFWFSASFSSRLFLSASSNFFGLPCFFLVVQHFYLQHL